MKRIVVLGFCLLLGAPVLALNKIEFMQQFEGRYLSISVADKPLCLKVSKNKVRAVNKKGLCARLARAGIRQNGEICIKPDKPGASARCELTSILEGRLVWGSSERLIQSYPSKQALLLSIKLQQK